MFTDADGGRHRVDDPVVGFGMVPGEKGARGTVFWDKVAGLYDLFENIYNKKVYRETGQRVAERLRETDVVLECACGTGSISWYIADRCRQLTATDYSEGMLKQAKKNLASKDNVTLAQVDITHLPYGDQSFDAVVAGNVIHLLPDPQQAMEELLRVCKEGGKVILPTYINKSEKSSRAAVKFLEKLGADFKQQFDADSYRRFFADMHLNKIEFTIVEGRMPCDIAVITKENGEK